MTAPAKPPVGARAFEAWMLSNLVGGAIMGAFVVLLIPPFVTQMTGSAARAGVVFAVMALAATTGPAFGRLADRYGLHRPVYTSSFVGMALAFVILAIDGANDVYSPIAGILLGISMAAKNSTGSAFLVGSGLPEAVQAKQLTVYNLMIFAGQLVGGALVALLHLASVDYAGQFWVAAGLIAAGALLTAFATRVPARRLRAHEDARRSVRAAPLASGVAAATSPSLRATLRSPFGALLAVVGLGGVCLSVLSSQIANIFPAVFDIDPATTSILVAAAGALGVPTVILSGAWLARSGPAPAFGTSVIIRAGGFAALATTGLLTPAPFVGVIAGALYLLLTSSNSLQRSPLPRIAALLAKGGVAEANGLVSAAGAFGAFLGCIAAGIVADVFSYEAVLWVSAVIAVLALLCLPAVIRAVRSTRPSAEPAVTADVNLGDPV